jgi:DNA adenine methylase
MRYVGGKARIAAWVRQSIVPVISDRSRYLEPFVGSGATFKTVAPLFRHAIAADAHEDLILLWKAIAEGWKPPTTVTREQYLELKTAAPSALRGLVGFGASFGGKWFGGYVDTAWDEHWKRHTKAYLGAARASAMKLRKTLEWAEIRCCDYKDHQPDRHTVAYCDPPYANTLGYGAAFDTAEFWQTMKWVENGALVVVSEMVAPPGWDILAERDRKAMFRVVANGEQSEIRREILFWKRSEQPTKFVLRSGGGR